MFNHYYIRYIFLVRLKKTKSLRKRTRNINKNLKGCNDLVIYIRLFYFMFIEAKEENNIYSHNSNLRYFFLLFSLKILL